MHDAFFMVLSDKSSETRVRHSTIDIARNEAKRLAGLNPGTKFFVLASLGHMVKEDPVAWQEHEHDPDQIPF